MNQTIKEILIGIILGDGSIRRSGKNTAFVSFEQSTKKTEYFNYLYDNLKKEGEGLILSEPRIRSSYDPRYDTTNGAIRFSIKATEKLKPLADIFLNEVGKKIIPSYEIMYELLTPRALAF
jgi:hypothetical protein